MRRFCETLEDEPFRLLATRYYDQALRTAKQKLGDEAAAQDAVQKTLIRVVRGRNRYNPAQPFAPWFHAVLRNVCTDMYRMEARRREALAAFSKVAPALATDGSARDRLMDLTVRLPPGDAELLRLRFVDGLSLGEIGCRIECSLEAAKKRLQRLVKRLKH